MFPFSNSKKKKVIGLPYDPALDVWAVGCTLYELYTGKILFPGKNNNHMLKLFMEVRGKMSHKMIKKGEFGAMHFDENFNFISKEIDKFTQKEILKKIPISKPVRELSTLLAPNSKMNEEEKTSLKNFVDLLEKCFSLNPEKRITPREALAHPFLLKQKPKQN